MGGRALFRNITAALKVFDPGRVILADAGFGHGAFQATQNVEDCRQFLGLHGLCCDQGWAAT